MLEAVSDIFEIFIVNEGGKMSVVNVISSRNCHGVSKFGMVIPIFTM